MSNTQFRPGEVWLDTEGNPIQAHGGGVLHHEGVYYWYGENKSGCQAFKQGEPWHAGVNCYSSRPGCFIAVGDRWISSDIEDSRYV